MGVLSSWAMLAITHHVLVKISQEGNKGYNYQLIGDDLILVNANNSAYINMMNSLGVGVAPLKTFSCSHDSFTLEYAKH